MIKKIIAGVTHGTVTNYLRIYRISGISGLKTSDYKGQPGKLHAYTEQIKNSPEKQHVSPVKEAKQRIK